MNRVANLDPNIVKLLTKLSPEKIHYWVDLKIFFYTEKGSILGSGNMPIETGFRPDGPSTRVLLIEGNISDCLLIEHYLKDLPFAVDLSIAKNLSEGREFLCSQSFDCILLDQFLPDGEGISLLQELSQQKMDHAVVVLSRSPNENLQQQLLSSGASDYLDKSSLNVSNLGRVINYSQARHKFVQKIYQQEQENNVLMEALRDTNIHLDELVEVRTSQFKIAQQLAKDKAKQAEQASKVKSEFLAVMSHEIRTPLNGVIGMLELLNMTELNPEQREFVGTAKTSAQLLLSLISDILDISRIEAGRFELADSGFDLRDILEQVGMLLRPKAEEKGINFSIHIGPVLYPHVMGDAVRLRQILINLGDNAIKYTDGGDVTFRVERLLSAPDGKENDYKQTWVCFSVHDTGIGIDANELEKIFDPFTQVDSSFVRRHGGAGLGLAIVYRLVDIMGGTISVESVSGQGSTFTCCLPFYKCMLQQNKELDLSLNLAGQHFLIVEANPYNSEILQLWLNKWGASVKAVSCGCDALNTLSETMNAVKFNSICIADELPDMDGRTLREVLVTSKENYGAYVVRIVSDTHSDMDIFQDAIINTPVVAEELALALFHLVELEELTLPTLHDQDWKTANSSSSSAAFVNGQRVLLVEDNLTNQLVATNVLEKIGFSYVDCVDNGEEAVNLLRTQAFDLVLMDCQLPDIDGYQVTQIIRRWEREEKRNSLPIIAITANAMSGDRERCLEAGMDDYVAKPIIFETLKNTVEKLMDINPKNKEQPQP